MSTIQPLLVPCTGTLADLHVTPHPSDPETVQVYWGTALLQILPRDKNSLLFRIVVGLLLNLKFRIGGMAKVFGVSEKTLRVWRNALTHGHWHDISGDFHGPGAPAKLRPDVMVYIRTRYRQACGENHGKMPYGFGKSLAKDVTSIWPDQEVCEETLRKLFRQEDETARGSDDRGTNRNESRGDDGAKPTMPEVSHSDRPKECSEPFSTNFGDNDSPEDREQAPSPQHSPECSSNLSSNQDENREECCDSSPAAGPPAEEQTAACIPSDTITDDSLASGLGPAQNPQHSPDSSGSPDSNQDENRKGPWDCWSSTAPFSKGEPREEPFAPGRCVDSRRRLCGDYLPILSDDRLRRPFISQHAGFLLLSPWFDEAVGGLSPILRQTSAQILCGSVNQEQGKLIDYPGFERLVGKAVRDLDRQRILLDHEAARNGTEKAYACNARFLKLQSSCELVLYCDTHHSEYTGCEKTVLGWSGREKKMLKGLMLEVFHTVAGAPCMIGHYDNFYDGRQRFVLLRARFKELLHPWSGSFTWVHDRGYWGYEFLRSLIELGDHFIQWEKNYQKSAWNDPYQKEGSFEVCRQGNSRNDRRELVEFRWREQKWDRVAGGRRFIVRARKRFGEWIEVAIVTNHPTMPAQEVICLMFDRYLQENDFSYLNRHFGLKELTSRKFDRYEAIAGQLEDRQIKSRTYKATQKEKQALREKLRQCLFQIDGLPATSLAAIDRERCRLHQQLDQVKAQLNELLPGTVTTRVLERITQRVQSLQQKFEANSQHRHRAEIRLAKDEERRQLRDQLTDLNKKLAEVNKTESRILVMIEENYVCFNMDRKSLVDAMRITSRNVFCCALQSFRPNYDNFRDDHVVLRALTRAAGVIVPQLDHLAVYLQPCLDRQPAQWVRVEEFVRCCEKKIEKRFGTRVRFHIGAGDDRIFDAVERARRRAPRSKK
jgi:hypothetical protein